MHYYNMQSEQIAQMDIRIKELQEANASLDLALDLALDEIESGRGRERRLLYTVVAFGMVAVLAIMRACWLEMGR